MNKQPVQRKKIEMILLITMNELVMAFFVKKRKSLALAFSDVAINCLFIRHIKDPFFFHLLANHLWCIMQALIIS